jgi:hypothetical protein
MRVLTFPGLSVALALALSLGTAGPRAAGCDPVGKIQFVCDQAGPEDLAIVPGGQWVIATAYARDKGGIRLINVRDRTTTVLFPTSVPPRERFDAKTYDSCPGPVDPTEKEKFQTHGIFLRPGKSSVHTVYVVHHGGREAIEVFEFDARARPPTLTWIGCAVAPDPIGLNAVIALPEGGFAATNWLPRGGDAAARDKMMAGANNGELWEWHTGTGWKIVPGSEASGANGLELSKDGKWYYIAEWGSQKFMRLSRGQASIKRDEIPVGFRIDNLRWAPDDSLLAAGQEGTRPNGTTHVIKINPNAMKFQEIIREPYTDAFAGGTVAIQVGNEIWVGVSGNGERIARFPAVRARQSQ